MCDATLEKLTNKLYRDHTFNIDAAKVQPNEFYATTEDMVLVSMVASCVLVCVRDKHTGIGGMMQLAITQYPPDEQGSISKPSEVRQAQDDLDRFIGHIINIGANPAGLEAKLFGASNIIEPKVEGMSANLNLAFVLNYLKAHYIPVTGRDVLGNVARKVYFFPKTGKAIVKVIKELNNDTMLQREIAYVDTIRKATGKEVLVS